MKMFLMIETGLYHYFLRLMLAQDLDTKLCKFFVIKFILIVPLPH